MPVHAGFRNVGAAVVLAFGVAGCEAPRIAPLSDNITSDRQLPLRPWAPEPRPVPGIDARPPYAERLTLRSAVRRVLVFSPAIKAAFLEIEARRDEEAQAAVKPNPELLLEVENFGGSRQMQGFDSAEETVSISQTIELGDKRLKRLRAAHLESSLAGWDFEAVRVQAALDAAQAFVDVLAAQERLKVLRDFVGIAEQTRSSVEARVTGGRASPIELDRAVVALARAKALAGSEEVRVDAAKRKLASLWGAESVNFGTAVGRLGRSRRAPSFEHVKGYLDQNPALARWTDGIAHRVAQLDVERSKGFRDLKLSAGVRRLNEDDSVAAVASLSMPLQVFDRNLGGIAAAERRLAKVEQEKNAARNLLVGTLVDALGALKVAATQLDAIEGQVLPAAERAFERTQTGYREGRFDILYLIDAQRSVFEARHELVNARADYEKARAQVEALIGRDLDGL